MVRTIGIRIVQDADLSAPGGPIARASRLFTTVNLFNRISPDKVKDGETIGEQNWVAKHMLEGVLVEL